MATESVTDLTFRDEQFDIVIFKSVLGGLNNFSHQKLAIEEIYRVLKPHGILLFAENLESTQFHKALRRRINKFSWRYLNYDEIANLFEKFHNVNTKTIGFVSLFFQKMFLSRFIGNLDKYISHLIPEKMRYMIYGVATKHESRYLP